MPIAEAQGEWLADYARGVYALPSQAEMERDVAAERDAMHKRYVNSARHTMQVDFDTYMNGLRTERRLGRERARRMPQLRAIEADATRWRPVQPVDVVILSYALTMIPDWRAAIDNAIAMLKTGGVLGVVDFHVSSAHADPGSAQHGAATRWFWPRWFRHDGVCLDSAHLSTLRRMVPLHGVIEARAPMPWLPLARVPYYRFVGRVLAPGTIAATVLAEPRD
jgi:SAM-dependent methyltransferase